MTAGRRYHDLYVSLKLFQHLDRHPDILQLLLAGYFAFNGQWSCIVELPQFLDELSEIHLALAQRIFFVDERFDWIVGSELVTPRDISKQHAQQTNSDS